MDDMSAEDLLGAAKRRLSAVEPPKIEPVAEEPEPKPVKENGTSATTTTDGEATTKVAAANGGAEGDDNRRALVSTASEEEEEEESEEDEDEDEEKDVSANDLLAAVKGRMEQQKFMDEVKVLRQLLEQKDQEIKTLNGQLQMAISTKHSLLIANSELEARHQEDMQTSQRFEEDLRTVGRIQMDMRAEIEKDFMNDLTKLTTRLNKAEEELSDREDKICKLEAQLTRKQIVMDQGVCEECVRKKEIIDQLQKKVRQLEKIAPRQETDKVKFYKAKLGL